MSAAKKLRYDDPDIRALPKKGQGSEELAIAKKKWRVDIAVLITWMVVFALAVGFWLLILKLF
jgi:hypothetical protein